ncbi:MAG: ABC transporter ATP-binding protein [Chloroflexi bacterium]|nr:ABC transporter ATP-binding protein [Chloroflexota bacterium]
MSERPGSTRADGPAIELADVWRRFWVQHDQPRSLLDMLRGRPHGRTEDEFWALRGVSWTVAAGDTVGLIGANGSGKSTTLKLLTGIMRPTRGRVIVRGQVSALIELGAGFHPDFSGRDNVFLNGALLGLSQADLRRRFAQIVAFAELEPFIDVPVKRYSSGMYMRLAFAIAAHAEPDVLLVDEVLAVGDEAFQRRCLDRLRELKQGGVTAIYVSHALDTVRALCDRVIWLDRGTVRYVGPVEAGIAAYRASFVADGPRL